MSKYFIAYRHTGADENRLAELLPAVKNALENAGHEIYCTYFMNDDFVGANLTNRQIMDQAFAQIENIGQVIIILDTNDKSEGMLMEIGYCYAKKIPTTLLTNDRVTGTYVTEMVDRVINYNVINDLCEKLTRI